MDSARPVSIGIPPDPPASAPLALRAMWTLVKRYGLADDVAREAVLSHASLHDLTELVSAVTPALFSQINAYLDETRDSEEAVPFGDLAQAALEAASLLRLRGGAEGPL
jgi:hypothetical protein